MSLYNPDTDCFVIVFYNQQSNVSPDMLAFKILKLLE